MPLVEVLSVVTEGTSSRHSVRLAAADHLARSAVGQVGLSVGLVLFRPTGLDRSPHFSGHFFRDKSAGKIGAFRRPSSGVPRRATRHGAGIVMTVGPLAVMNGLRIGGHRPPYGNVATEFERQRT